MQIGFILPLTHSLFLHKNSFMLLEIDIDKIKHMFYNSQKGKQLLNIMYIQMIQRNHRRWRIFI